VALIRVGRYRYHEPTASEYQTEVNRGRETIAQYLRRTSVSPVSADDAAALWTVVPPAVAGPDLVYVPDGEPVAVAVSATLQPAPFCLAPGDALFCDVLGVVEKT
jgi:hypothetical protein